MLIQHFAVRQWQNKSKEKKNCSIIDLPPQILHYFIVPVGGQSLRMRRQSLHSRPALRDALCMTTTMKPCFWSNQYSNPWVTFPVLSLELDTVRMERKGPFSVAQSVSLRTKIFTRISRRCIISVNLMKLTFVVNANKEQTRFTILNCVNYRLPKKYCYLSHYLTASNYADYIAANSSLVYLQRHSLF